MSVQMFGSVSTLPTGQFHARRFQMPAWQPAKAGSPKLGQEAVVKTVSIGLLALPTALAATTAYVGFRLGAKDSGLPSVLGYIVGLTGGLATFGMLLMMLGVALVPIPERTTREMI